MASNGYIYSAIGIFQILIYILMNDLFENQKPKRRKFKAQIKRKFNIKDMAVNKHL